PLRSPAPSEAEPRRFGSPAGRPEPRIENGAPPTRGAVFSCPPKGRLRPSRTASASRPLRVRSSLALLGRVGNLVAEGAWPPQGAFMSPSRESDRLQGRRRPGQELDQPARDQLTVLEVGRVTGPLDHTQGRATVHVGLEP